MPKQRIDYLENSVCSTYESIQVLPKSHITQKVKTLYCVYEPLLGGPVFGVFTRYTKQLLAMRPFYLLWEKQKLTLS